ncbi:MAG: sulfite exporter TauE/SafE family protein [Chloroflexota bacterium]
MELSTAHLALGAVILLVAGLVRGLTGFGLALVAVPFLSMFISPKVVVPVIILQTVGTNIPLVYRARAFVQPGRIWPLVLGALFGLPLGSALLIWASSDTLRVLIGSVVTVFALALIAGLRVEVRNERLAFLPVGFTSGVLNGSSSLSGPPVILFFANQDVPPRIFRANIIAYFFLTNLVAVALFWWRGLFTHDVVLTALVLFPPLALGTGAGDLLSHRINPGAFRVITLAVVLAAGLAAVASGAGLV